MAIQPDALFSDLLRDLTPHLFRVPISGTTPEIEIYPWDDVKTAASKALLRSFYKKLSDNVSSDANAKAVAKFLQINSDCENFRVVTNWEHEFEFFGNLRKEIYDGLASCDLLAPGFGQILDHGRMGPGASIGARGGDFYTKLFSSRLSCTRPSLADAFRRYTSSIPRWFDALEESAQVWGPSKVCEGNHVSFVPKDNTITRTICTEPSLNMFYQLGLGRLLEQMLDRRFGLNIETERPDLRAIGEIQWTGVMQVDRNRALARLGSISGSFSTIDLRSASDSMSLALCRHVFPRTFMWWLEYLRSPVSLISGRNVELHMVSTMGNGFTFPLQTFFFACVVRAAYRALDITIEKPSRLTIGNYGVYGDDIVVDTRAYNLVCHYLTLCGFTVNSNKSFSEGVFRESCGADFFRGEPIRGVYCKSIRTVQDRYVLLNRLNQWTALTGIPLVNTVRCLLKSVPKLWVPLGENDDAGIKCPFSALPIKLSVDKDCQSVKYRRWIARQTYLEIDGEGSRIKVPKGSKTRSFSYNGLVIAALGGFLESYRIPVRHDMVRYRRKVGISPNWDYIPMGLGLFSPGGNMPLIEACLTNMMLS